jgi:ERCC4-type nuclease
MNIVIDSRETHLIELITNKIKNYKDISFEVKQLDIGDIEIWDNENILFVLERKTINDLLSSLQDKRYHEQSLRLSSKYPSSKIIYLIEGILNSFKEDQKKIVNSCITSLSLEKGFHIFKTASTLETSELLLQCVSKLIKLKCQKRKLCFEDNITSDTISYSSFIKTQKKDNISKDNIYEIFLCQIPDVSSTSATAIMNYFENNFSLLIENVNNNPEILKNILCGNGDKKRKISKKIVSRLIEFLSIEETKK